MNAVRRRAVLVAGLMGLAFVGARAWRPSTRLADQRPKVDLETLFPPAFGEWGVDTRAPLQLVSPDTAALLNRIYNQTLSRTYVGRGGQRMMLSVAYGGDQSDATRAHRPEVCYPAQGFQLLSGKDAALESLSPVLRVRQLVARMGGRTEPITYWLVVGDHVALNGTEQKMAQLAYGFKGLVPDGMLVRVSSIDAQAEAAFAHQERFIAQLSAAMAPALRPTAFGTAAQ